MGSEAPLAECLFGWGRVFHLYQHYLDVNGICYPLTDLTRIRPIYQRFMGISSLRLELRFGKREVILRGIGAIEDAQKVIDYLASRYLTSLSPQEWSLQEQAQAPTDKVEVPTGWRFRQDEREQRRRHLQSKRSLREYGFDVEKLAQRLKEELLPGVPVPLRLMPGEQAHYSTDATLCGEPAGGAMRCTYPAKDHGRLILTNKRLVYMGRKSQIVLDYTHLLHVSRLRGAIAFQADHWYRREIFEVRRPLECNMYLECILERLQQQHQLETIAIGEKAGGRG